MWRRKTELLKMVEQEFSCMANLHVIVFSVYVYFLLQLQMKVVRGRDCISRCWSEANWLSDMFLCFSSQLKYAHLGACVGDDLRPDSGKESEFSCAHQWFIATWSRASFPAKLYLQPDQLSLTEQKLKLLMRRLRTTFEKFFLLVWLLGGRASAFLVVFLPCSSL